MKYSNQECNSARSHNMSVGFKPQVDVLYIEHKKDFLSTYGVKADSLWYTRRELRHIKGECATILQMIAAEHILDANEYCSRGLEGRMPSGSLQRRRNRNVAWNAVLNEQATQWKTYGTVADPHRIREIYLSHHAAVCQEAAHHRGLRDERSVQAFYKQVDPTRDHIESRNSEQEHSDEEKSSSYVEESTDDPGSRQTNTNEYIPPAYPFYSSASKEAAYLLRARSLRHSEEEEKSESADEATTPEGTSPAATTSMAGYSTACKKAAQHLSRHRDENHLSKLLFQKEFPTHGIEIALDGGLHAILEVRGGQLCLTPAAA